MRNLGGAIGIALIDTIIYGRVAIYAENFRARLLAGDLSAAVEIGLDPSRLANRPPGPPTPDEIAFVRPMVEKASLALCVNEAWAMLAGVAVLGFLLVFLAGGCAKERAANYDRPPIVAARYSDRSGWSSSHFKIWIICSARATI